MAYVGSWSKGNRATGSEVFQVLTQVNSIIRIRDCIADRKAIGDTETVIWSADGVGHRADYVVFGKNVATNTPNGDGVGCACCGRAANLTKEAIAYEAAGGGGWKINTLLPAV